LFPSPIPVEAVVYYRSSVIFKRKFIEEVISLGYGEIENITEPKTASAVLSDLSCHDSYGHQGP
jgi:hypothetical protein